MIEPYARIWLSKQFIGHRFEEKSVQLTTGEDNSKLILAFLY
jgi:frataxin-like iron-binding protein CyaY